MPDYQVNPARKQYKYPYNNASIMFKRHRELEDLLDEHELTGELSEDEHEELMDEFEYLHFELFVRYGD